MSKGIYQTPLAYDFTEKGVGEFHLNAGDHFICGEELSISGRWVQHALHPMSAVGKILKYKMVFGDCKATAEHDIGFVQAEKVDSSSGDIITFDGSEFTEKGNLLLGPDVDSVDSKGGPVKRRRRKALIPDYPLMPEEDGDPPTPRAVGEAKMPWNHDFEQLWLNLKDSQSKLLIIRALGRKEKLNGRETLYCSQAIPYDASPHRGDKISVRQALLFLQHSVSNNTWHAKKVSNYSIIRKRKNETVKAAEGRLQDFLTQTSGSAGDAKPESSPTTAGDEKELAGGLATLGLHDSPRRTRPLRFADHPIPHQADELEPSNRKSKD
ncbi:hypothetical protein AJ79_09433 [Helicocarpus griseus UAMH5409]|uniref:Uncharacterized protein n=1 Tax=Helicocarpus griseus UAMH5409 TaxID=1447875 RepID=A0A2B7WJY9_9EURO|nr:hypothetical protein AJ79_09433 [Helicocarpus griseus UAMH5409]